MDIIESKITEWKEQYGSVYVVPADGEKYYFRSLTRKDYMEIMQQQVMGVDSDPEVETVKRCILNDVTEDIWERKGGLATVIYEQIMLKSGFVTVEAEEL